jgi:hypothetical protein
MRTYMASAYTTNCGSTKYGASDGRTINIRTRSVRDDCEVSIHKDRINGSTWKM